MNNQNTILIEKSESYSFGEYFLRKCGEKASFLDTNNINWKIVDGKMVGKRSVWTFDFRACWLEDTLIENVKSWWCGQDADYLQIFQLS